ncbi:epidermal differentiation-specific protein-like [Scyliorhinus torazame]|uniref:Beta/gamma crystallin 'Greek key' domain-containing protein n=1 Tax=Scyliorhinus torazame TaxID=75743 RepID=A0A401QFD3_SCYTO|nr:hypothetical protein [Scyliorhinus torazame]
MSKIVLYEQPNFTGKWKEFRGNVPDLAVELFAKTARSLKVEGKHWVAYKGKKFTGDFVVYGAGDYNQLGDMDTQIESLRLVKEELGNPDIVLYENINFCGQSRNVDEDVADLRRAEFDHLVSSHKVKQGVWILYDEVDYQGNRLITFQGDECADYREFGWNDKLASLKALK